MIRMTFMSLAAMATPAFGHVGHLGEAAGHDHWVAGAAVGLAIGLTIWGALKGRKDPEAEAEDPGDEEAIEEEPA